jgi:TPR repeat protein
MFMRTFSAISSVLVVTAAFAAAPALAFDASTMMSAAEMPPPETASSLSATGVGVPMTDSLPGLLNTTVSEEVPPTLGEKTTASEAFNMARNLYRRGEKTEAMNVLQFAANQGHIGARWMIGRMYARGEGVAPDDFKAFEYFRDIVAGANVEDMDDTAESRQNAAYISHALVQLGSYYREGIPGSNVKPNPQLAISLYSRAAYNFADPSAQFNLAMMYVEGNGVPKDPKRALQLFHNAAKKGHGPSRALLGHMMFKGEVGKRQPEMGLAWMAMARQSAEQSGEADAQWIIDLHDKALAESSEEEKTGATGFLDRFFKR